MKHTQIQPESLEHFIKIFLPEGKLNNDESLELTIVSNLIDTILSSVNQTATLQVIFEAFYNLHYPMSVIEPLKEEEKSKPYIDTNSHAIYIAIDLDQANKLDTLSKFIVTKEIIFPDEIKQVYRLLDQFKE